MNFPKVENLDIQTRPGRGRFGGNEGVFRRGLILSGTSNLEECYPFCPFVIRFGLPQNENIFSLLCRFEVG